MMLISQNVYKYTNFESQIPVLESVQVDYLYSPNSISKMAEIVKNELEITKSSVSAMSTELNDSTVSMKEAIRRMTHKIEYYNGYNTHSRYKKH